MRDRGRHVAIVLGGLVIGLTVGVLVGWLLLDEDAADAPSSLQVAGEIAREPERYFGERVRVTGEVSEVLGPRVFAIGGERFLDGRELLVATGSPMAVARGRSTSQPVLENDLVTVSGQVDYFAPNELEQRFGADFERELDAYLRDDLCERRGDPVVIAASLSVLPKLFPIHDAARPAQITSRPREYFGSIASVSGEVTEVHRGTFVLDDVLLVITPPGAPRKWSTGDRVRVLGAVRRFDPDQARRQRPADFDDPTFGVYADKPALVAQSVEISD